MDRRNKGKDPVWYALENALIAVLWWLARMGLGTLFILFLLLIVAMLDLFFHA